MTTSSQSQRSVSLMLGSVLLFAVNVLVIRGLSIHVPAADGWVASLFRGVVGLIVVWIFFAGKGLQLKHLATRPLVLLRGAVGAFGIIAFYLTIVHLGAARAVIINLSYPMFGALFAAWWLREYLPIRSWLWMALGFAGLVIFLGGDAAQRVGAYDLLALAGAVAAGAVVTLIRLLRHTEHTATIYASQCGYSALFALWPAAAPTATLPSNATLILIAAAAIVAAAQLAMTHAYRELSVARGSSIQILLPIVTAVGGYFFFGERFTPVEIGGAVITLVATWLVVGAPESLPPRTSEALKT